MVDARREKIRRSLIKVNKVPFILALFLLLYYYTVLNVSSRSSRLFSLMTFICIWLMLYTSISMYSSFRFRNIIVNLVLSLVQTSPFIFTLFFLDKVIADMDLYRFVGVLITTISFRLYAVLFQVNSMKIFLNVFRFALVVITTCNKYGNYGLPDLDYADRAILASLIFDTIFSSVSIGKFGEHIKARNEEKVEQAG